MSTTAVSVAETAAKKRAAPPPSDVAQNSAVNDTKASLAEKKPRLTAPKKLPSKVQLKLGGAPKPAAAPEISLKVPSAQAQRAFVEDDSDDDAETADAMAEMCRMRMKNRGRDTPTSAGPNSFLKSRRGFEDRRTH